MRGNSLFKWVDRFLGLPLVWLLGIFKGQGSGEAIGKGSRVLFVKFSAMGDTLLLLPLIKAAKAAIGTDGRLVMVGTPVNQAVIKNAPWLDAYQIVEPSSFLKAPWKIFGLILELRRERLDIVIDFDQWLRISAILSAASGAKSRVGFETPGQGKHAAFHRTALNRNDAHEFEQFKELLGLEGVEPYAGFLKREGFLGAAEKPRETPKLAVLHPGTGGKQGWQREWPIERFAELSHWLKKEMGARVSVSGAGPYEAALCAQIPSDESCVDGGLKKLVETLCRADLVICGNTGVMHMAAGLGTPVLALHGPNPHIKWGPLAENARVLLAKTPCSPCLSLGFEFGCPQRPCMESISVKETETACSEMLHP